MSVMPSRTISLSLAAVAALVAVPLMAIGAESRDICVTDALQVAPGEAFEVQDQADAGQLQDSAAVAAVVERYHHALTAGDSVAALSLLADDVVVLESGGIETREEYRSHHLPSDIAFARAVQSTRGPVRVVVRGDVAWATSTSVTQGEFRGRAINSMSAELMVLVRDTDGWRISAIHWSSRARRS